ncbi:MAG: hypothetical protein IJ783_07400 [Kiritimatiellae bacterium]|nr:hypothetical protein [Kiritimatiellia bacterium]
MKGLLRRFSVRGAVPAFAAAAVAFAAAARAQDVDFSGVLRFSDESFASLSADSLDSWPVLGGRMHFEFQDPGRTRAVWMGGNRDRARLDVRAFDFPVYEIRAAFGEGGAPLVSMEFVLFSRGDVTTAGPGRGPNAGRIKDAVHDDKAFKALFSDVRSQFEETYGKPAGSRVQRPVKDHEQRQFLWNAPGGAVVLSVGNTLERNVFKGEYIRAALRPGAGEKAPNQAAVAPSGPRPSAYDPAKITARRGDVAGNVKRRDDGLVFVDNVPMVDQGDKGYCVVATLERLVRYYGGETSQHELAQLFNTGDGGGTMMRYDRFVAPEIRKRFGFREDPVQIRRPEFEKLAKAYDDLAASSKLPWNRKMSQEQIAAVLESADRETLHSAAATQRECKAMMAAVKGWIDKGIPLVWLIPGHMRMIVGYDETKALIAYSDSWGAGHECKTMPLGEAWLLTRALFAVHP